MVEENERPQAGFQFSNFGRNEALVARGFQMPKSRKTGTTIAGIVFKDGVVLGADTRATEGDIVADKNCCKIHYLQPNMYCCGAGTAADLEMTTQMMASQLELHRLNTGRQVPVIAANTMLKQMLFRYQGYVGAALVLGGVDKYGSHIYSIHPHGSTDRLPYTTMGSGSLAAMSVFESRWKPNMELDEAKQLVRDGIAGGVFNDLGSGSNIDLCVITKDGATMTRPYDVANVKGQRVGKYEYKRGVTEVLNTVVRPIEVVSETVKMVSEEEMDTA
ncbi:proteasome subunit beta type-7-like [Portunus trituberculatus]|uniref:proteasome subunit beta type-7-like n=1 Tax=Portunus trituberculatus TaxID=210409 RepID=UPI001E1D0723|nr:proteasome subunit beta type-7-like [Portunus trituberculatus]